MTNNTRPDELMHYGVLGMKWGVRRYQNPDGSLTSAGQKKYNKMSPDKVRKKMQKAVNQARGERYGKSNRWMHGYGIGEQSDKVHAKQQKDYKDWQNSEAYKKAVRDSKRVDKLYEQGKISVEKYDAMYDSAWKEARKTRPVSNSYAIQGKGRTYTDNYVQTTGKQLTIAYLNDLGFNDSTAKHIESIIRKSGKQTLD